MEDLCFKSNQLISNYYKLTKWLDQHNNVPINRLICLDAETVLYIDINVDKSFYDTDLGKERTVRRDLEEKLQGKHRLSFTAN